MTSKQTNEDVKRVLDKYLTPVQQQQMFSELLSVKGNKSLTDSIQNLALIINRNKNAF